MYEVITLKPPFRAEDMQGLYKKVLRGIYPKIPNNFSAELSGVVKALLQVSPNVRPTCDKILSMKLVKKRMAQFFKEEEFDDTKSILLSTIRVPKNLLYLTDRLPKPNYAKERRTQEEDLRRKTYDNNEKMLPDINHLNRFTSGSASASML